MPLVDVPEQSDGQSHLAPNRLLECLKQHPKLLQLTIWSIVIGSIVGGFILYQSDKLNPANVGYAGAFLINLVGSASVLIPVPGLAAVCAAATPEVGLNILALGLVGGAGATLGELTAYLAGYSGQSLFQRSRHYERVRSQVVKRGAAALFVLAILPLPFFDVAGIAAGSLGFPLRRFLLWVYAGKIIKFVGIAYACHRGIHWLTDMLNL
ncbi:MAG: VTT domain-containing protein [Chloroflexi bacterium]|nr:VTT domain-containing protein [Chloroflexota bacterium]